MSVQLPDPRSHADPPVAAPPWQPPDDAPHAHAPLPQAAPPGGPTPPPPPGTTGAGTAPTWDGHRLVPTPPEPDRSALSVTALVIGILELVLVVPVVIAAAPVIYPRSGAVVFAVAALLTAPAVVLAVVTLRRRPSRGSRARAVGGLVTGVLAMLLAFVLLAFGYVEPTLGSTVDTGSRSVEESFSGTTAFDQWEHRGSSGRVADGRMVMTTDGDLVVNWINLTDPPQDVALEARVLPGEGTLAGIGVAEGYEQLYAVTIDADGVLTLGSLDELLATVRTGEPVGPEGATLTFTMTVGPDGTDLAGARTDAGDTTPLEARVENRPRIDRLCLTVQSRGTEGTAAFDDFRAEF